MDATVYGRTLIGDSLGFHILFALLGVGIPLMLSLAELIGIVRKDRDFTTMARRWGFVMSTLFVTGAVSGMIISNQLSILWPKFMEIAGVVVGPAFYTEAFAFFVEAIFLGIYLYSWDRFRNPWIHWLTSLPIVLGAATSSFFITAANAWMNAPAGFTYVDGKVGDVNPLAAIFNKATWTETTHSIVSYYLTTALLFAGVYAWRMMRDVKADAARKRYYGKAVVFGMTLAAVMAVLINVTGDQSAKYIVREEPMKLAAAEGLMKTTGKAPFEVGGWYDENGVLRGSIKIPSLLSFLAYGSRDAVVLGLEAFDPALWPPLWIHYMFDLMVAIGIGMTGVIALFFGLYFWRRRLAFSKPMLWLLFLTGFSGFPAVEFGWILTEVGRQPYAIRGIMLTKDAFTTTSGVMTWGFVFPLLYLVLLALTPWILVRHYRRHPLRLS